MDTRTLAEKTGGQVDTRTLGRRQVDTRTPADLSSETRESMSGGWHSWRLLTGCQPFLDRENWLTV